jgi:hypothetical protein
VTRKGQRDNFLPIFLVLPIYKVFTGLIGLVLSPLPIAGGLSNITYFKEQHSAFKRLILFVLYISRLSFPILAMLEIFSSCAIYLLVTRTLLFNKMAKTKT